MSEKTPAQKLVFRLNVVLAASLLILLFGIAKNHWVHHPAPDELYGCSYAHADATTGECK